ncbi:MAG: hypothetical protein AAF907_13705, partial [Planctomycetota bacterium]
MKPAARRFIFALALVGLSAPDASAQLPGATGKLEATPPAGSAGLFVGVSRPASVPPAAPGAVWAPDDAILLAHVFVVEYGLIPPGNCVVAIDAVPRAAASVTRLNDLRTAGATFINTTQADLTRAIRDLSAVAARAGRNPRPTTLTFAAFGFGGADANIPFFAPSDADLGLLRARGLSLSQLRADMARSAATHRLVFWDASLDRSFPNAVLPAADRASAAAIQKFRQAIVRGRRKEALITGFELGESSFQVADARGGLGLTAWGFAAALALPATDANGDGVLTLAEVTARANANIQAILEAERQKLPGRPVLKQPVRITASPATLNLPLARTTPTGAAPGPGLGGVAG